ncbi:PH and SEC7 domain-containing protein 4 [Notechis scutatus]|uniref:PH and SEC7 domain-containing protein 4 n=1 Tax=Notechis scutatus TaxID=8663 RepID=A0A6J1VCK0_9SAUR|nr:PH and SEC7 domain-containing protein 4 [Notechis scutatus]XP_026540511.1 PH and SEC7 domain-containing protein 4 [Notechis scutatus]XP_026540512.1 PH and SEC7 domain-containing protein 4 [Notechis scutatus]XP_026540513.1 PH and SEC7 domain-containing protein 4 [Notechis scutatus]
MEYPGRSSTSDVMDVSSDDRTKEASSDPGEALKQTWDPLAFSGACRGEDAVPPPSLGLVQDRLGGVLCRRETPSEKSIPVLMQNNLELLHPELGLDFSERSGQPFETIKNLKTQDTRNNDATQSVFWAGILQAQLCVLDLQEELDKQEESLQAHSVNSESLDSATINNPSLLASDSEEEPEENLEKQEEEGSEEEEEEEEEEVEYLFFNNPLFQESPHLTRTFEGQVPWSQSEEETSTENYKKDGKSEVGSGNHHGDLFSQAKVAISPVGRRYFSSCGPDANEDTSTCSFPSYVPHYRSLSPLIITERDLEITCSWDENSEAEGCFLDPLQGDVLESITPEPPPPGYLPAEGLLFSTSGPSLMSPLLQESTQSCPAARPASPGTRGCVPSSVQVPSAPAAGQSLQQERLEPRASPRGHPPSPPRTWLEEPERTSSPQKDVSGADVLPSPLCGAERKPPSSVERCSMVELPAMQSDGRPKGRGEEPALHCHEEAGGEFGGTGQSPPAKVSAEANGSLLLANGTSGDLAAAQRLAARLYHLDGFRKSQVAAFLQKNNPFSQMVAEAYLSFFHFSAKTLDQALRSFLKSFVLTGETQERERILMHFSQRYHCCNPEASLSPDAVHTLTCAMMLLNTDLHGQNIGRSMSCQDFVVNLTGLNEGNDFPKELLKALYSSIRHEKLEWATDEEDETVDAKILLSPTNSQRKTNPFLTVCQDQGAKVYQQGLLARKVHAEADGKKTPWGKRSWKTFHAVLKGTVLYFLKDEQQSEVSGSEELIGIPHALAETASKYTKRPNVFRLQTADWHIFLFQAPTSEEMTSWISRINLVAAMFSAPPFPAAVGSQRRFIRPILPTAPCKNSIEDQHLAHEACMDRMSHELLELQRNLPEKRGRGRDLEEYQLRKEYLLYEKRRYETYVKLLEVKLGCSTEDLDQWEARLAAVAETCPSLQKSHSSPSLNVDGPPAGGAKVKRNISERRTVRRIIPKRNKHLL